MKLLSRAVKSLTCIALGGIALIATGQRATAVPFGGVEFPAGEISFADTLIDYSPGTGVGSDYRLAEQALGAPDYTRRCAGCDYVSLGNGGSLVLEFSDNYLTGSGDADLDLWVFEIGTAAEAAFVEISQDGQTWFDVGQIAGATGGIDIDAFGFGTDDLFSFVRLTDDLEGAGRSFPSAGADIDAVGAISTLAKDIPEPSLLLGLGTLALASGTLLRRKR